MCYTLLSFQGIFSGVPLTSSDLRGGGGDGLVWPPSVLPEPQRRTSALHLQGNKTNAVPRPSRIISVLFLPSAARESRTQGRAGEGRLRSFRINGFGRVYISHRQLLRVSVYVCMFVNPCILSL